MSIVVAGARGSLGPFVVDRLHDDGHDVVAVDKEDIDVLDEAATRDWAASLDGVTGVVHLVGGWKGGTPLPEASLDDWALLHDLLVRTVQHTTRAFAPALRQAGGQARFVLVSSDQAQRPSSTNAAYGAAKAAAEAWTLAYADELAETGGAANILVVKAIVTPQMREANPDKAYSTFTDARHMADAIALLVSQAGGAMNGQRLSLHR
jgi:NAD(P)-dependent dehydrogenase (short-subunit alcohol dehydrogenase family)